MTVRAEIRRLPWPVAGALVLLALAVLLVRAAALLVCLLADGAVRIELAATSAAGIGPLSPTSVVLPGEW